MTVLEEFCIYHVLVRAVGARPNETGGKFVFPALLFDEGAELRKRSSKIGSKRAVDTGFQFAKVLYHVYTLVLASPAGCSNHAQSQ